MKREGDVESYDGESDIHTSVQLQQSIQEEGDEDQTLRGEDLIYSVEIINESAPGSDDPDGMALWAGLYWEWGSGSIKIGYEWVRFSVIEVEDD